MIGRLFVRSFVWVPRLFLAVGMGVCSTYFTITWSTYMYLPRARCVCGEEKETEVEMGEGGISDTICMHSIVALLVS